MQGLSFVLLLLISLFEEKEKNKFPFVISDLKPLNSLLSVLLIFRRCLLH